MKDKWDDRYSKDEFAYGEQPNHFYKEQLGKLPPGSILLPAEGEGRNAVYAAIRGWNVSAFDLSEEGKRKASQLADKHQVSIEYKTGELETLLYHAEQFDVIALIYAHLPAAVKSHFHKTLATYLKHGGTLIFEAFSKKHLEYMRTNEKMGGPKEIDDLFSMQEIREDFSNFEIIELKEQEIELNEGLFHVGKASVVRFVGRKR